MHPGELRIQISADVDVNCRGTLIAGTRHGRAGHVCIAIVERQRGRVLVSMHAEREKARKMWRLNTVVTYRVFYESSTRDAMRFFVFRCGSLHEMAGEGWLTACMASSCNVRVKSRHVRRKRGSLKFLSPFDAKQCVFRLFIHSESCLTFAIPMTHISHRHHMQIHQGIASPISHHSWYIDR